MKNSQQGFIAIDFLFGFTVSFGLIMIVFALSFTFVVAEISQYIVYSSTRAMVGSNVDVPAQILAARKKFKKLTVDDTTMAPFFKNGLFDFPESSLDIRVGIDASGGAGTSAAVSFLNEYPSISALPNSNNFTGIRATLKANILNLKLPFIGTVVQDDEFSTKVLAVMIREVTNKECNFQMQRRRELLHRAKGNDNSERFTGFSIYSADPSNLTSPWEDNGC